MIRNRVSNPEGDFDNALTKAWEERKMPSLLQVKISPTDHSQALLRLAEHMSQHV